MFGYHVECRALLDPLVFLNVGDAGNPKRRREFCRIGRLGQTVLHAEARKKMVHRGRGNSVRFDVDDIGHMRLVARPNCFILKTHGRPKLGAVRPPERGTAVICYQRW